MLDEDEAREATSRLRALPRWATEILPGERTFVAPPLRMDAGQTKILAFASGSSFGMTYFPSASIPLMISSCLS